MHGYGRRSEENVASTGGRRPLTQMSPDVDAAARVVAPRGAGLTPNLVLALQRVVGNRAAAGLVQRSAVPSVLRSPGRPLDGPVRAEMEARLGADFGSVRVHDDAAARDSAAEVGARAYTSGEHVVLGRGGGDRHTLAHELTHVVQQRSGPVDGTTGPSGLRVSDPSDRFERAAEENATRVLRGPVDLQRDTPELADDDHAADTGTLQRVLTPPAGTPPVPDFRNQYETPPGQPAPAGKRVREAWMVSISGRPKGSPPHGVVPEGYGYIQTLGLTSFWIRFHLVNEKAGGPGDLRNLVPASKRDNSRYERDFEQALKDDVEATTTQAKQGDAVFFGVEVTYGNPVPGTPPRQQHNARYFPTRLIVSHQYFDAKLGTWSPHAHHGQPFNFMDTQPADPGLSLRISALTQPQLLTLVPGYAWDNDDVRFLNELAAGKSRNTEFENYIDEGSGLGAIDSVRNAFETIKFSRAQPAPVSGRPQRVPGMNTTTFAERIDDANVILNLSRTIAQGNLTLT